MTGDDECDEPETEHEQPEGGKEKEKPYRPSDGMMFAHMAVSALGKVQKNDTERRVAFEWVRTWIIENV